MRFLKTLDKFEHEGIKYYKVISSNDKFYYFKEIDKDNIKVIDENQYLKVLGKKEPQKVDNIKKNNKSR